MTRLILTGLMSRTTLSHMDRIVMFSIRFMTLFYSQYHSCQFVNNSNDLLSIWQCTRYADQGKEVTEFIQTASNAASPDDADAMLRAAVLETLETMQGMADTGIVDKKFGKKALAMFEA